ncbi:hypothetical protein AAY473_016622 [Plecturocebus cupreus]
MQGESSDPPGGSCDIRVSALDMGSGTWSGEPSKDPEGQSEYMTFKDNTEMLLSGQTGINWIPHGESSPSSGDTSDPSTSAFQVAGTIGKWGFVTSSRLVWNSWAQAIHLFLNPQVLGLQTGFSDACQWLSHSRVHSFMGAAACTTWLKRLQILRCLRDSESLSMNKRIDMGFCHVGQDGLRLLTSSDPPTLASQSAGITGGTQWSYHSTPRACHVPTMILLTESLWFFWDFPRTKEAIFQTESQFSCTQTNGNPFKGYYYSLEAKQECTNFFILRQGLTLLPRLKYSGTIIAHSNLNLLGLRNPPMSACPSSWYYRCMPLCLANIYIFKFLYRWGSHYDIQAGLRLLASCDSPALASQSAGVTGVSHAT